MKKELILIWLTLIILLGISCFGDPNFHITVTNNTADELIVYYVVTDSPNSKVSGYYLIGRVLPGKSIYKELSFLISQDKEFNIVAENNVGQTIYYDITGLPVTYSENENVVFNQHFTTDQFVDTKYRVMITKSK